MTDPHDPTHVRVESMTQPPSEVNIWQPSCHDEAGSSAEGGRVYGDTYLVAMRWVRERHELGELSTATAVTYRQVLTIFGRFIGGVPMAKIGKSHIEGYLKSMASLSPGTRRNRYAVVRTFFDAQVAAGRLRRSPCAGVKAPKVPRSRHRALVHDQCSALLAAAPDARARCVVILGLQLGLRRKEIAGLEVGDIDWSARTVDVIGKGGHRRIVPLTDEAGRYIEHYLTECPANGGPLIRNDRYPHDHVKPEWVGRLVAKVAYEAGVKAKPRDGVSTHALRHTAATDVYQNTRDVLAVRDFLGHASTNATQIYVRGLDVDKLRSGVEGRRYGAA